MNRRELLAAAAALTSCRAGATVRNGDRQRGVAFDDFRSNVTADEFRALAALGVTHAAFTVWGYMRDPAEPTVVVRTSRDDRLIELTTIARSAGLDVLFVPTIGVSRGVNRSDISMRTQADWRAWFRQYGEFVGHTADLAAEAGAAGMTIGMELRRTVGQDEEWRAVADAVRQRFPGWLTYAANWDDYESVEWWSVVDYIGVQAYFELGVPAEGTNGESRQRFLRERWRPIRDRIEAVSRASGRPVLFTEIGYPSWNRGTERPWSWREEGLADSDLQADAYTAAFQTFWSQPWFAGMYWWKWYASDRLDRRDWSRDYTPQNKPAQQVLEAWYNRAS